MNNLLKVYCGDLLRGIPYLEILNANFGFKKRKNIFGDRDIFDDFNEKIVEIVNDIKDADCILIPHYYFSFYKNNEYIIKMVQLSRDFSKRIIIFSVGDNSEDIKIDNSIILRMSKYRSELKRNEIIIPAYAADLSYGKGITYRVKNNFPVIGFCGWANINNYYQLIQFYIKNIFKKGPYKQGLYFRKKAIEILNKDKDIKANFIIRKSYSANENTIEIDPRVAREEYRENIINSDFTLAPKGDGNYSVRFYETLSLGRIPILIDTDCPLPYDNLIDYSKFVLRIDYRDINKIGDIVVDFYKKTSNESWINMQKNARQAFEKCLRIDVFLKNLFIRDNILKIINK